MVSIDVASEILTINVIYLSIYFAFNNVKITQHLKLIKIEKKRIMIS